MANCFASASFPGNSGTEYLNVSVVAFGELAEDLLQHVKGDNVTIYGDLTPTSYVKNGEAVKALTLTLGGIQSARTKRRRPGAAAPHHRGADAQGQDSRQPQRQRYSQPFYGKSGGRW